MNEELKAIDWLRAKTISYESRSEELHYALILYNLIMNLQKENQELKKELSNSRQIKNQQKEFIEWLERRLFLLRDEASELALGMCSTNYQDTKIEVYKEVLSKYKEIIGGLDE